MNKWSGTDSVSMGFICFFFFFFKCFFSFGVSLFSQVLHFFVFVLCSIICMFVFV